MGQQRETCSLLDQLARGLRMTNVGLQATLDEIVSSAVRTIEPAQYAGLILVKGGQLIPQATLGRPPHELDLLQQRIHTGPCWDAADTQQLVRVDDTSTDTRWKGLLERCVSLGVASMVCVPLWVDDLRLGALSLYGERPRGFTDDHVQLTQLYATLAALALADAQRVDQLQTGLTNRDLIGQAKGILMERLHVTDAVAFDLLASASQRSNMKLIVVARHLAETGELLGVAPGS
jgi:GAF domain-containing protein